MGEKGYIQYSKRLCGAITAFWCVLRIGALGAAMFRPELGEALGGVLRGADDVMIFNVACYAGNSIAEKGMVRYFAGRQAGEKKRACGEETPSEGNG